jgi:adenosylhomocysteine nucleosidase
MSIIGIIGAMDEEISVLKSKMDIVSVQSIVGVDFHMGTMAGKSVALVCSGIGKVNAAVCAQVLVDRYAVDYVINVGVAGAIGELKVGDVVISGDTVQHDFDCSAFGHEPGFIPRMQESEFKSDDRLVKLALDAAHEMIKDKNVVVGRVASGDAFVSDTEKKAWIYHTFEASCVEMEGAAIAQTCWLNRIPFVIIRTMSDSADEDAGVSFDESVVETADAAGAIVARIVERL